MNCENKNLLDSFCNIFDNTLDGAKSIVANELKDFSAETLHQQMLDITTWHVLKILQKRRNTNLTIEQNSIQSQVSTITFDCNIIAPQNSAFQRNDDFENQDLLNRVQVADYSKLNSLDLAHDVNWRPNQNSSKDYRPSEFSSDLSVQSLPDIKEDLKEIRSVSDDCENDFEKDVSGLERKS